MSRGCRFPIAFALACFAALLLTLDASASGACQKTPLVVRVERGGFRFSDAGVGTVAGIGISLAVCGCLALVRLRDAGTTSRTKGEQP
jgi:hypothetical protein